MYYFPHWASKMPYVIEPERERVFVISWLKIDLVRCCIHDTSPDVFDGDMESLMHNDNVIFHPMQEKVFLRDYISGGACSFCTMIEEDGMSNNFLYFVCYKVIELSCYDSGHCFNMR